MKMVLGQGLNPMRRREFISLLGSTAVWPLAARAQQAGRPRRIAVLMGTVETAPDAVGLRAVLDRLKTLGWTEGVTARIDIRWSKSDPVLMRENALMLLALSPDVVLCHSNPALAQLRPLSGDIPIVFVMVADPVGSGFVDNLAHPGGNITGFTVREHDESPAWLSRSCCHRLLDLCSSVDTARWSLPSMHAFRTHPMAGALASYGVDIANHFRPAADYIDRILKGEKPANLPVQAPTKFELVINLKTAKARCRAT
jgi:ABC-type uncharacterized transport system substrate-binding protein